LRATKLPRPGSDTGRSDASIVSHPVYRHS
jgi:hypothetical protein